MVVLEPGTKVRFIQAIIEESECEDQPPIVYAVNGDTGYVLRALDNGIRYYVCTPTGAFLVSHAEIEVAS